MSRYTVWSYLANDDGKWFRRTIFFYAGSQDYGGAWMKPTDCVWFVPILNPWLSE